MSDPRDPAAQADLFDLPLGPPSEADPQPAPAADDEPDLASKAPTSPPPEVSSPPPEINAPPIAATPRQDQEPVEAPAPRAAEAYVEAEAAPPGPPTAATLGRRILSGGADVLVHAGALATAVLGLDFMGIEHDLANIVPLLLLVLSFSFLYTVISLSFWGQTAGMAWLGIAARQSPQFPISFAQATLRWVGGLVTFCLAGLPLLLALGGGSLSDRISHSQSYSGFFEAN